VAAVDVGASRGPDQAHHRIAVAPGDEVALLTMLRAAIAMPPEDSPPEGAGAHAVDSPSGEDARGDRGKRRPVLEAATRELGAVLSAARYAVIVADAEPDPMTARDPDRADALVALAQALNGSTRAALSLLRGGGNRSGADAVMTWLTGYPMAVDFARGYPTYRPHDGTAPGRLARGDTDAVLVIGSASPLDRALASVDSRRLAAIGPRASAGACARGAAVIDTGVAGIHESGTALRMDDVPLPLRASMSGPADTAAIVRALSERIVARRRQAVGMR
jgi:formylmethanofuran dehydrogenase subunit B